MTGRAFHRRFCYFLFKQSLKDGIVGGGRRLRRATLFASPWLRIESIIHDVATAVRQLFSSPTSANCRIRGTRHTDITTLRSIFDENDGPTVGSLLAHEEEIPSRPASTTSDCETAMRYDFFYARKKVMIAQRELEFSCILTQLPRKSYTAISTVRLALRSEPEFSATRESQTFATANSQSCDNQCQCSNSTFPSELARPATTKKMERNLEKTMDDVNNADGVTGCILADQAGLCLGAKGNASGDSAGLIAAIADQAGKLEPGMDAPIICLQNDTRQCLIQRQGPVVGAIYKNVTH